jgi:hypothetical protein
MMKGEFFRIEGWGWRQGMDAAGYDCGPVGGVAISRISSG